MGHGDGDQLLGAAVQRALGEDGLGKGAEGVFGRGGQGAAAVDHLARGAGQ